MEDDIFGLLDDIGRTARKNPQDAPTGNPAEILSYVHEPRYYAEQRSGPGRLVPVNFGDGNDGFNDTYAGRQDEEAIIVAAAHKKKIAMTSEYVVMARSLNLGIVANNQL